ncbi:hypothetical protein NMG60_11012573 [Bertholletia excelsa]
MGDSQKAVKCSGEGGDEEQSLLEGMAVLDFDVLCSKVAMQTHGKWQKLEAHDEFEDGYGGESGGVLRMWEGEVLECFEDRQIALETACCPCYRFGKNMGRAGFGSCPFQGMVYFILVATALLNCIAFLMTKMNCFLYLGIAFAVLVGFYSGFYRTQIRNKFNIRGSDSSLDCVYHFIFPCCALCQESRTLDMNNVQNGTWHGRGDTICIGEGSKAEQNLPIISTTTLDNCILQKNTNEALVAPSSEIPYS